MINNYHYFIALAEELNISKAANKLFISHQCLSKYLKNLETEYDVIFFERDTSGLKLTPSGEAYLKMARDIQFLELNLKENLAYIKTSNTGILRFSTTEGRYRLLIPELLTSFNSQFPQVKLETSYAPSNLLYNRVLNNEVDLALVNSLPTKEGLFEIYPILHEPLYMVVSDNMLKTYFGSQFPDCKENFKSGIDLSLCQDMPFIMNFPEYNSRKIVDKYLASSSVHLKCIQEFTQLDLQFLLAARDYAACFTLAMYIPSVQSHKNLNLFPIKNMNQTSNLVLIMRKNKILPDYATAFINLLKKQCKSYAIIS